jgi:hypothetical protein
LGQLWLICHLLLALLLLLLLARLPRLAVSPLLQLLLS